MSVIDQLTGELSRLPGIGPKTALRLVHHLMKGSKDDARRLSRAVSELADRIRPCTRCGNFSEQEVCEICSDPRRDGRVLCVVEEAFEVGAIERTGHFDGLFHVLGGRLSPLDGIGPEELNVATLLERIGPADGAVQEVIIATNASVEGEATAVYLEQLIRPMGPRVTRLARGIPVGSDLEYVDGTTIATAAAGALAALVIRDQISRHRRNLFSPRALRRLAALGHMSREAASVDNIRLLRDFIAWEPRKLLRERARAIVDRMVEEAGATGLTHDPGAA